MIAAPSGPLWCEDFDADLPKVVPNSRSAIGAAGLVELVTYATPTNGRINCPSAWHTDHGLTAFFATDGYGGAAPPGFWTDAPSVGCTFWEAVRDEWIHDATIVVNGRWIWTPPGDLMMRLMYDLRGWTPLDDLKRAEIQRHVRASLTAAADRLRAVVEGRT